MQKLSFRFLFFIIIILLSIVIASCTEDCPYCPEETDDLVVFVISVSNRPVYFPSENPNISVEASFFGGPIPDIEYFHFDDSTLTVFEQSLFPYYSKRFKTGKKEFLVETQINNIEFSKTFIIPDSFALVEPLEQSIVPSDTDLVIRWTESNNFDHYFIGLLVYRSVNNSIERLYDVGYNLDSNSTIIPAQFMKSGYNATIQVMAIKGPRLETGQEANYSRENIRGHLMSGFNLGVMHVWIE